jgi:hypothetical protein
MPDARSKCTADRPLHPPSASYRSGFPCEHIDAHSWRSSPLGTLAWCSFRTPMICSSVNLLRFMSVPFAGEQTNRKVRTFQGSRSFGAAFLLASLQPQGNGDRSTYVWRSRGVQFALLADRAVARNLAPGLAATSLVLV